MGFFDKTKNNKEPALDKPNVAEKDLPNLKHIKPKILFVDLPGKCSQALINKGFNVTNGTLGKPYKVEKSSKYLQVKCEKSIPNQSEQEIIVIDLLCETADSEAKGEVMRPASELDIWAKCDRGVIDPRVVNACFAADDFGRILDSGGAFVIFLDRNYFINLVYGKIEYGNLSIEKELNWNTLGFLEALKDLVITNDNGEEMFISDKNTSLGKLLDEHLENGKFFCTIQDRYNRSTWSPIAKNKHGDVIALEKSLDNGGTIILLPQIANKSEFLVKFFTSVLPETCPKLFPSIEKGKWCHKKEYELKNVLSILEEKSELERETKLKLINLDRQLVHERNLNGWIHDLLTGTGDPLVSAVEKALNEIGFQKVIDVDKDRDKAGKSRREDLQILDKSPIVIVDVKGISNFPSDEDVLQAAKHAMIRMKELSRTDIESLSIINHQRHLPPLDRDNSMPFRQEIIDAAETQFQGLMTSWDLYRILINKRKFNWKFEDVMPIFYRTGRIPITPENYKFIGKVTKVWKDKFGLIIEEGELNLGDKISIEFPIEFMETILDSIYVNDNNVTNAKVNDRVGLIWPPIENKLREGMSVFKVIERTI